MIFRPERRLNKTKRKKLTFEVAAELKEKLKELARYFETSQTRLIECWIEKNHFDKEIEIKTRPPAPPLTIKS